MIMKYRQFNEARLPGSFEEKTLSSLPLNAVVYVVPWMMRVNMNSECFLLDSSYSESPGGTVILKVKKVDGGFIAYINDLPEKDKSFPKQDLGKYDDPNRPLLDVVGFEDIKISNDLDSELKRAIENEDYRKAAEIRNKMKNK